MFSDAMLSVAYWREMMDLAYEDNRADVAERSKRSLALKLACYEKLKRSNASDQLPPT